MTWDHLGGLAQAILAKAEAQRCHSTEDRRDAEETWVPSAPPVVTGAADPGSFRACAASPPPRVSLGPACHSPAYPRAGRRPPQARQRDLVYPDGHSDRPSETGR
ncbi:hypothetical protein GCM10007036_13960 [Alsobacter metallidurans]|uniref:Uncharacterized protein n=1 Tax=Alsobacter metallidurans TaxID=340221 RepID=A0A917I5E5_9HYPH|nr:hypothetical protein GCM10007036_13960 [Alsobacter metallidurans]